MEWYWIVLAVASALAAAPILTALGTHVYILRYYLHIVERIFQEMPPFRAPIGEPEPDAEDVALTTPDGAALCGCYLPAQSPRCGVILFGLEFGSNRWAAVPYTQFLRAAGYDVFTFEMRGQGDSPASPGYTPLQWVTEFEVADFLTALAYLKSRPDRHPRGIGFFGLSKGGSAGLIAAAGDDFVRCCVTDGAFASLGTMVPYMQQWIFIYVNKGWLAKLLPTCYYAYLARLAIRRVERTRGVRYQHLETALPRLAPRPLLMIHGGGDKYIRPEMARALFARAGAPKDFWLVERAKHNQSFHTAHEEYTRRVRAFFDAHLGTPIPSVSEDHRNGVARADAAIPSRRSS